MKIARLTVILFKITTLLIIIIKIGNPLGVKAEGEIRG